MGWHRFFAGLIDVAIAIAWVFIVYAGFMLANSSGVGSSLTSLQWQLLQVCAINVPILLSFSGLEASQKQGTLGKRLFKLRVHGVAGISAVGFPRALVRNLLKFAIPFVMLHLAILDISAGGVESWIAAGIACALGLSYAVCIFFGQKRTLYDYAVGTFVIKRAYRAHGGDVISDVIESVPRRAMR